MENRWLTDTEWIERYRTGVESLQGPYLGCYSSVVDGFFQKPWGFWVPLDDHIVHRGDGIFEAARAVDHAFFDLNSHLTRLQSSADKISLKLPFSTADIRERCLTLARLCNVDAGTLRVYVSRGPGGFTQNPYEPKKSQLYIALTPWKQPPLAWYESGVRAGVSRVLGKRPFEATIKSCNYLQNVMQKKETIDRKLDFTICLNLEGEVLEGSTESFMILSAQDDLLIPSTDITLRGTTLEVVRELAQRLVQDGQVKSVVEKRFHLKDIESAKEIAFVGTTIGVCPVTTWESAPVGSGRIGPVCRKLGQFLDEAMRTRGDLRTSF